MGGTPGSRRLRFGLLAASVLLLGGFGGLFAVAITEFGQAMASFDGDAAGRLPAPDYTPVLIPLGWTIATLWLGHAALLRGRAWAWIAGTLALLAPTVFAFIMVRPPIVIWPLLAGPWACWAAGLLGLRRARAASG